MEVVHPKVGNLYVAIRTNSGRIIAEVGDYIVKFNHNDFTVMRSDMFEKVYAKV